MTSFEQSAVHVAEPPIDFKHSRWFSFSPIVVTAAGIWRTSMEISIGFQRYLCLKLIDLKLSWITGGGSVGYSIDKGVVCRQDPELSTERQRTPGS